MYSKAQIKEGFLPTVHCTLTNFKPYGRNSKPIENIMYRTAN